MRRYSLIILAAALGLLVHPCGDALAGPAREGITPRPNQAAPIQSAKPGGPTASAPFVVVIDPGHGDGLRQSRRAAFREGFRTPRGRGCWPRSCPDAPR